MKAAGIGILLDNHAAERLRELGQNVFQTYLGEILAHAGIAYRWISSAAGLEDSGCDIVLVAAADERAATKESLLRYIERGGVLISYGGIGGLAGAFGCRLDREYGAGYAHLAAYGGFEQPIRYLRAVPWVHDGTEVPLPLETSGLTAETPDGRAIGPALQQFARGNGFLDRWAVDIPTTVVQLQQGSKPVTEDGAPAPDGTAAVNDGFLKADDVYELSWAWDRRVTETGQPYFAFPYADWWRDVLVAHVVRRAIDLGFTVPMIDYWPDGVTCVAAVSHDSDGNLDAEAEATLELMREVGVSSTWCMLEPGYSPDVYPKIREAGHELAFHYNAVEPDKGFWDAAEFDRQLRWLRQAIGTDEPVGNKNHLTRMEGWGEFFRWCERGGVSCDQSRGPSKKGNVGFLFGTCHPYFPIALSDEANRLYDVLEIGFLTQDIDHGKWADSSIIVPFLEAVRSVRGVAHFLIHQFHIYRREEVRQSLKRIVREARARGFTFWTVGQIEGWERYRRRLRVTAVRSDGSVTLEDWSGEADNQSLQTAQPVVLIPVSGASSGGEGTEEELELRFGVYCRRARIGGVIDADR